MRGILAICIALSAALPALAEEAGCDGYNTNKTGGDPACDAAIAKESDGQAKSMLLFRRAYMEDATADFAIYPKAMADLDEALKLWPQNTSALRERGYLFNEYERWKDAETDLDAYIRLKPTDVQGYRERSISRFGLADLQGTYEDYATMTVLEPDRVLNLTGRAEMAMWLGRFDDAKKDLDAAEAKAAGDKQEAGNVAKLGLRLKQLTTTSGGDALKTCLDAKTEEAVMKPTFAGDCTRGFLDAKTPKEKADALTQRSTILPVLEQSRDAGLPDARIAYALDPGNPEHAFNLGGLLINIGDVHRGLPYVEASLKARETYYGLAARASAKYQLGDMKGAFADGKKSFELKPNELALTVIGDAVYAQSKSYDRAKGYWIGAYHLGDRDDGLIERLKQAGVPIPPPDYIPPDKP